MGFAIPDTDGTSVQHEEWEEGICSSGEDSADKGRRCKSKEPTVERESLVLEDRGAHGRWGRGHTLFGRTLKGFKC